MTPSQAILAGSAVVALAIVGTSYLDTDTPPPAPQQAAVTAPAPAPAAEKKTALNLQPGQRYQIIKVDGDKSWRLDTHTGEISVCGLERDRMVCAKSTEATRMPTASPKELERERHIAELKRQREMEAERAEQEKLRREKREERNETLKTFMNFFERIIRFAQEQAGIENGKQQKDDGDVTRL